MNRNGGRHSEPSPTIASAITRGAISLNGCLSGYSQSLEATPAVRLTLSSTTFGEPRLACETFSPEKGNARESAEACAK
jgi:hypothetical protein